MNYLRDQQKHVQQKCIAVEQRILGGIKPVYSGYSLNFSELGPS